MIIISRVEIQDIQIRAMPTRTRAQRYIQTIDAKLQNAITGGSLLEIGCGYGYLLEEAKNISVFGLVPIAARRELSSAKADKL
jgi:2-polyprenyl-3-methyl-5-hydroxy-6-metoxy-1,4-benzoquinol methylase